MCNAERIENEFGEIVAENIHREGIDDLMEYLYQSDFFKSPASTKYHGSYEGGLAEHSINVYYSLLDTLQFFYGVDWEKRYSKETVAIVSLFHDLCKIGRYKMEKKNMKNTETGAWEEKFVYVYNSEWHNVGHGAKSIMTIMDYMYLTDIEKEAIYWHMGAYDVSQYSTVQGLCDIFRRNTLAYALHSADMDATYITENEFFEPIPLESVDK